MIRRFARFALIVILAAALVIPPPPTAACGPDFTGPQFVGVTYPEFPYADYARGKLEILQHTYWHEPLYVGYRNLSGKPFTSTELKVLTEPSPEENATPGRDWVDAWKKARAKVAEPSAEIQQMYDSGYGVVLLVNRDETYIQYYNCLDNAFEFAVRTLDKRVEQFGPQSAVVKDWVAAQDQVFQNCSGAPGFPPQRKPAIIPAAANATDLAVVRADRSYQVAAAYFYTGQFSSAQEAFEAIAKDSASPYQKLATYLAARTLVRKGTINSGDEEYDSAALGQAEAKLRAILADKSLAEMHAPAQRLLGFVEIRLHRQERFAQLEGTLSAGGNSSTFRQDLTDYLWLLDNQVLLKKVTLPAQSAGQPPQKTTSVDESTRIKSSDITDWILTFQQTGDSAYQHSLERWQTTKSLPWLVAAIAKVSARDKAAAELSAAAAKVAPESPAYLTLAFHRLRLLEQSGNRDTARQQVDQLLAQRGAALSRSARNQFFAMRMKLATNLEDSLHFAPRISSDAETYPNPPVGAGTPDSENASHFDADASIVFTEKLPLQLLAEAAESSTLSKPLRREVLIEAWTRAILLDREATARDLVPTATELVPEAANEFAEYKATSDVPSARFVAVLAILRNPGFRPFVTAGWTRGNLYTVGEAAFNKLDNLQDNWWCALAPAATDQSYGTDYYHIFLKFSSALEDIYPQKKFPSPAFLSPEQCAAADKEHKELEALSGAPNWLGQRALEWTNTHPDDPRVPEALHLVVRAWRYGCAEHSGQNYSKAAYDILHKRYPSSEWTKRTPYWFN